MPEDENGIAEIALKVLEWIGDEPFRLFAALCLGVGLVAFIFFRNEGPWFKTFSLVLLFAGVGGVGFLMLEDDPIPPDPDPDPAPIEQSFLSITELLQVAGIRRSENEECLQTWLGTPNVDARACVSGHVDQGGSFPSPFGVLGAIDNSSATAWVFRKPTNTTLPYLYVEYAQPIEVAQLFLANGFSASDADFVDHERIRDITLWFSDGESFDISVPDQSSEVALRVSPSKTTRIVLLTVRSTYSSDRFEFAGLNSISLAEPI